MCGRFTLTQPAYIAAKFGLENFAPVDVTAHGSCKPMRAGDFMYLSGKVPHALRATEDAAMLVSIVVEKPST
jgi:hypothetical protein